MDQLYEQKDATLIYRSVLEAAEELEQAEALELLVSFIHLGLGDYVNLDECSKVVRLILKQNVASLIAADNRHKRAVANGMKGKESGIKGKEHGNKGGRPRKGETKEEAYERRNPAKTPQETPVTCFTEATESIPESIENPAKTPLKEEVEEEVYVEEEIEEYVDNKEENESQKVNTITVEKNQEYYLNSFLDNPTKDYRCLLDDMTYFLQRNNSDLLQLQENLKNNCGCDLSISDIVGMLQFLYKERVGYTVF